LLPFLDGSFDGVLCMNALHHLPSYGQALREVHRVLKPGGAAVFSEPGTTHAAQPLSTFRMREESVIEKNVSLPLVRRLAIEAGFSRMRVVPLRSGATPRLSTPTGPMGSPATMWDETLRVGPGEHAHLSFTRESP
jgi:SAM-dependent methyltransferase